MGIGRYPNIPAINYYTSVRMNLAKLLEEREKSGTMKPLKSCLEEKEKNTENMKNADLVINKVISEVDDIFCTSFQFDKTGKVPNVDDSAGLTFSDGRIKKGKEITTCVLFVDIRNSVALNNESYTETLGRIYTSFTKSVLRAAAHCNGYVRNIIGDRVMVVFPEDNCFQNAIDCAITINHIVQKVINPKLKNHDFKCGIGIDYGRMRCIKVGVEKHGTENSDNKNLVWIGQPANMASRLCDQANKTIDNTTYIIEYNEPVFKRQGLLQSPIPGLGIDVRKVTKELSEKEFLDRMSSPLYKYVLSVKKNTTQYTHAPILVSKTVYNGFKSACPSYNSIKNETWKIDTQPIKDVAFDVYGHDLTWDLK